MDESADISALRVLLMAHHPPKWITQNFFEHSPEVFDILCREPFDQVTDSDIGAYLNDLNYFEIQVELFRYLLPKYLALWKSNFLEQESGAVCIPIEELFFPALHKNDNLKKALSTSEFYGVEDFIAKTILQGIDIQNDFHTHLTTETYRVFNAVSSFAVVFPNLNSIWDAWWSFSTTGRAITGLRYISLFMYRSDENPFYAPWSKERGGGPPSLNETGCQFQHAHWKEENVVFLRKTLTVEYLQKKLEHASASLYKNKRFHDISCKMLADFPQHLPIIDGRLADISRLVCDLNEWLWSDDNPDYRKNAFD